MYCELINKCNKQKIYNIPIYFTQLKEYLSTKKISMVNFHIN